MGPSLFLFLQISILFSFCIDLSVGILKGWVYITKDFQFISEVLSIGHSIVRVILTECGDALTYSLKAGIKLREKRNITRTSKVAYTGYYRVEYLSFLQTKPQSHQSRFQALSKGVDKTE